MVAPRASDETKQICADLAARHDIVKVHIQTRNPGAGWAIQEGMKLARFDYVAMMSADLETEPEAIQRMYEKMLQTDAAVVVANRWDKHQGGFQNYHPVKYVCNWIFSRPLNGSIGLTSATLRTGSRFCVRTSSIPSSGSRSFTKYSSRPPSSLSRWVSCRTGSDCMDGRR